ncbi:MAG: IS110 family transposase, partial [Sphingobacteriales bacterium]
MSKEAKVPIVNANACGIDVGSRAHYVALGQGSEAVKSFGVYTQDHQLMVEYLKEQGVKTIAMESTGNYWQTLFAALEKAGFEVFLVCGTQTKNVKGRKTDVQDCQWIQWLHSVGMLSHSFIPNEFVSHLRVYSRQRLKYIQIQTRIINQLQRDLRAMNLRLEVALNDITGKSGCAIIEAILAGERNPVVLAGLADFRVKKSKEEIALSLEGNWDKGFLFVLNQHYREYKQVIELIKECEKAMDEVLGDHLLRSEIPLGQAPSYKKAIKKNKNTPCVDFQDYSFRYFGGVDLFAIEGINQNTVLTLMAEVGTDITKFRSSKAFASWLHICPNEKVTGGKVISSRTKRGSNPLSQVLKSAGNAIGNMKIGGHLLQFFKKADSSDKCNKSNFSEKISFGDKKPNLFLGLLFN